VFLGGEFVYAIVDTGGQQFRAEAGAVLSIPKIDAEVGASVTLEPVLFYADGDTVQIGRPTLPGVTVRAEVVAHGKERKVYAFKLRRRKNSRRIRGHRQQFTRVRITEIAGA
jgi:large subunit ribosomal protein L21